jgi:plastocyanin
MSVDSQASLPEPTGSGAIHTVLVAPDGAGLRYMPFAINASIGDTVRYVWTTPANHTVTLSSALAICNKSALAEQLDFASGARNASAGPQTCQ